MELRRLDRVTGDGATNQPTLYTGFDPYVCKIQCLLVSCKTCQPTRSINYRTPKIRIHNGFIKYFSCRVKLLRGSFFLYKWYSCLLEQAKLLNPQMQALYLCYIVSGYEPRDLELKSAASTEQTFQQNLSELKLKSKSHSRNVLRFKVSNFFEIKVAFQKMQ